MGAGKTINQQINELSELLGSKGYDGQFFTNQVHLDHLKDSVSKYLEANLIKKLAVSDTGRIGIWLETLCRCPQKKPGYVTCTFKAEYSRYGGFELKNLTLEADNFPVKKMLIGHAKDIPHRSELAKLVRPMLGRHLSKRGVKH